MRYIVTMKLLLCILGFLVIVTSSNAQDSSLKERLLQSKGNLRVSTLFNEMPVLPTDELDAEMYRMTFIPTFFKPIKIRVERRKAEYIIVAKRLSGQGGFDAGTLQTEKRHKLKQAAWQHLISLLAKAGFWTMAYDVKEPEPNEKGEVEICLDGSEWMLEGVKGGKLHAVDRYCPKDKRFQAVGLYLVKLSGLRIRDRELY